MGKTIKFGSRWGKNSQNVTYSGKYKNTRRPHVACNANQRLNGKTKKLGKRYTKKIGKNITVMYTIPGVKNGKYVAHFTAYYGPVCGSTKY